MIATARGLGRILPEDARLAFDPYGERFGTPWLRFVLARGPFEGMLLTVQVRTRLIDEAVLSFVQRGGRQVLLLGAGFDARAHRLPLEGARVFEVDHPATQARKRTLLASSPGAPVDDAHVAYLPWDFEARAISELPAALAALGHDPREPTLTLWEGVTMYLSEPAIDASVRAVAALSPPGSPFVFTYFERSAIKAPSFVQRVVAWLVASAGERLTFGFEPSELPAWLAHRDMTLMHDVPVRDAARLLLPERFQAPFRNAPMRTAFVTRA